MPRGRSKTGYGNRTDLANKVGGEMAYGEKAKLMAGQKAVPMANAETSVPAATAPSDPTIALEQQIANAPAPEKVLPLSAPSEFPNEDISQGLLPKQDMQIDPDITKLKTTYLPLFMQEAGNPNAPAMFRDFVKWLNNL
jgi:hypothetical protein